LAVFNHKRGAKELRSRYKIWTISTHFVTAPYAVPDIPLAMLFFDNGFVKFHLFFFLNFTAIVTPTSFALDGKPPSKV
jgi:hypothetical protein